MPPMKRKVLTESSAVRAAAALRKQGRKLVVVSGSFDLLHAGHIALLGKAKRYGDSLMVLLNSDASVRRYKGPGRPIVPERERAQMLANISDVDFVVLFDDINPKRMLGRLKPQIFCNGSDWGKDCIEREIVEKNGGRVKVIPMVGAYSTSDLLRSIRRAEAIRPARAVFIDLAVVASSEKNSEVSSLSKDLSRAGFKMIGLSYGGAGKDKASAAKASVRFDRVYTCQCALATCACAKPATELPERAVREFGVSLANSWLIGESEDDVVMGREANVKTVKIGRAMSPRAKLQPDRRASTLAEALAAILKESKKGSRIVS